jgi:hypothetical protein
MGEEVKIMAQSKPERVSVEEVLKLVDQLSPEEHEQLVEEMKLHWLRREMAKAEDSIERGELIDGEEVFRQLRDRNAAVREKKS